MSLSLRAGFTCSAMLFAAMASVPASAIPIPVDLSSWQVNGNGNWVLQSLNAPNDTVLQTLNSIPTVFFNGLDSQGTALSGTIKPLAAGGDDDFIGFVLGYDAQDLAGTNATTNYILVDWKQGAQSGQTPGMRLSRVTGGPIASSGVDIGGDAWTHTGQVSVLATAATLGNVGFVDEVEYFFDIIFNPNNIQVSVDGVQQFNINGVFENGSFGFYNFSQPNVLYAGITEREAPPICGVPGTPDCELNAVPAPATLALFGLGLAGLGWSRRKKV